MTYATISIIGSVYPSREFYESWLAHEYRGPPREPRPIVAARDVLDAITRAAAEGQRAILLTLDSLGGNNDCMLRIYNALRAFPGRVVVHVVKAASAATVVAQAADVIVMDPAGQGFGFHGTIPAVSAPDTREANEMFKRLIHERTGFARVHLDALFERHDRMQGISPGGAVLMKLADTVGTIDHARRIAEKLAAGGALPETPRARRLASAIGLAAVAAVAGACGHESQSGDGGAPQWPVFNAEARVVETAASSWFASASTIANASFMGVATNGTNVCAVGTNSTNASLGKCATSSDGGITYTEQTIPTPSNAIVWDPMHGDYVAIGAVGTTGKCSTSANGATGTWTDQSAAMPAGSW